MLPAFPLLYAITAAQVSKGILDPHAMLSAVP